MDNKIYNNIKKYIGWWIVLDDKDRIISYGKNKEEVLNKALDFDHAAYNPGFRLYQIFDPRIAKMLKMLLNYP